MRHLLNDPALLREQCWIGGVWTGDPSLAVTDPATGETLGQVPSLAADQVSAAIAAAEAALPEWRARTAGDRARILRRWFDAVTAAQEDLALILTREQGKPLAEARGEIAYAASYIEWFAEEAKRLYGEVIPSHRADSRLVVIR
ncbi:MAG: succinate-semialdehyde dehydrogenase (NADP(+)), partial [Caulobacter sp. 35-67-4]